MSKSLERQSQQTSNDQRFLYILNAKLLLFIAGNELIECVQLQHTYTSRFFADSKSVAINYQLCRWKHRLFVNVKNVSVNAIAPTTSYGAKNKNHFGRKNSNECEKFIEHYFQTMFDSMDAIYVYIFTVRSFNNLHIWCIHTSTYTRSIPIDEKIQDIKFNKLTFLCITKKK